jgi:1,4-dihydroxy-6-naphthoate synthase
MTSLNLSFSTCPNDTFMFDGLVNGRILTGGLDFLVHLADIEELNTLATEGLPDITKLSVGAFVNVSDTYELLHSGSAIGFGNGPLLVSKKKIFPDELKDILIAIPGEKTTANLLLGILFPEANRKKSYLFSSIEEVVLDNECDAGLLIHETRFTYEKRGLKKVLDLGEEWEKHTKLPVPLGCIAIRRNLPNTLKLQIETLISESVQFALDNPNLALPYMKMHAQDLSEEVMYKHVELYVNDFSVKMGKEGEKAVVTLLQKASDMGLLPQAKNELFLNS